MDKEERYRITWQDCLFGVTGSTIFVLALHFFTT